MGTCSTASRCELSPSRAIDRFFTLLLQCRHAFATANRPRHSALRDGESALGNGKRGLTRLPSILLRDDWLNNRELRVDYAGRREAHSDWKVMLVCAPREAL